MCEKNTWIYDDNSLLLKASHQGFFASIFVYFIAFLESVSVMTVDYENLSFLQLELK